MLAVSRKLHYCSKQHVRRGVSMQGGNDGAWRWCRCLYIVPRWHLQRGGWCGWRLHRVFRQAFHFAAAEHVTDRL